jgi:hypothetical protein
LCNRDIRRQAAGTSGGRLAAFGSRRQAVDDPDPLEMMLSDRVAALSR